jgi:hypothetical protein
MNDRNEICKSIPLFSYNSDDMIRISIDRCNQYTWNSVENGAKHHKTNQPNQHIIIA